MEEEKLYNNAVEVLKLNDSGQWTRPAPDLYPHQWLWDSAFTAIGLRHVDIERAKTEIRSLFRGQWSNGMIPHMIFADETKKLSADFWEAKVSVYAPVDVATSGITQPPMLAEAIVQVGQKLNKDERIGWYQELFPHLLAYHEWFYSDRNPRGDGLAILIHPWETGLDNTPPWMQQMTEHQMPLWIKAIDKLRISKLIESFRRDTQQVAAEERISTIESLMLTSVVRRLRRKHYEIDKILTHSLFIIEDIFVNSILIRANTLLKQIAKEIDEEIPKDTLSAMNQSTKSLQKLWDKNSNLFYCRNYVTGDLIKEPTIASLMPLYSGAISKDQAQILVDHLNDQHMFASPYPVPSVPLNSKHFSHRRYWQGPTWINTNWLLIDGLNRYGFHEEADRIKKSSFELVSKSGSHEYFSSLDGYGAGISPFSWTAALTIDLLKK